MHRLNKIVCPSCFQVFNTIHQLGKKERCPYCAAEVRHTAGLVALGQKLQLKGEEAYQISAWVDANLEILRLWWLSGDDPAGRDLNALSEKVRMFLQEVEALQRELAVRQSR